MATSAQENKQMELMRWHNDQTYDHQEGSAPYKAHTAASNHHETAARHYRQGNEAMGDKFAARAAKVAKDYNLAAPSLKEGTDDLDEATTGEESLKPNSNPAGDDPKSKLEYMTKTLGAMAGMSKEDCCKWFEQAMALIGKEASSLPAGAESGKNQSSIDMQTSGPKTRDPMPKLNVKEDVEEMFSGEDLSETFKDKAVTLFEAAVNARVVLETEKLQEQVEERIETSLTEAIEEIESRLDAYLDYAVKQWMSENEVAVESALRAELTEEFIGGLRNLFSEHYIDVPAEKVNVVEALTSKVQQLEKALDEQINESAELKRLVEDAEREAVLDAVAEGLTVVQAERFQKLAEGIQYTGDINEYRGKLEVVKENYFRTPSAPVSNIEEETFEGGESLNEQKRVGNDPTVNRYVQAISRTVKN